MKRISGGLRRKSPLGSDESLRRALMSVSFGLKCLVSISDAPAVLLFTIR